MSFGSLGLWVRLPPFLPHIAGRAGASFGFISQVFEFNSRPRIQNSHDQIQIVVKIVRWLERKTSRYFVMRLISWVGIFGLYAWELNYYLEEIEENDGYCSVDHDGRSARIALSTSAPNDPKYLKLCAFHEVVELLLCELDFIMKSRFTTEHEIDSARHRVIHILTRVLLPKY